MTTFKKLGAIILIVIVLCETEAYVGGHRSGHGKDLTENNLGHYRVKRAPQNPITTTTTTSVRPSTTLSTSTAPSDSEENEGGSEQVGQGYNEYRQRDDDSMNIIEKRNRINY